MNDSFSKIISILIAAVVMYIAPVRIQMERQAETVQTYILSETMYLVDNVRNTGILSSRMYEEYEKKVCSVCNNADIDILVKKNENYDDNTDDVLLCLENTGSYLLDKDDYFRIAVKKGTQALTYYGGIIKK